MNESIGSLSAEQISSRSKELKEGLARTAAEAEKQAIIKAEKDKSGETRSDELKNNSSSSPTHENSLKFLFLPPIYFLRNQSLLHHLCLKLING